MSAILHFSSNSWLSRLDEDFTEENVARIADAAGRVWMRVQPGAIVYVGYDARPEAERFACLAARVLAGCGLVVKVSDRSVPTPALSRAVGTDNRSCGGLMVTGSHSPYDYLGVKLYMADGGVAPTEFLDDVEAEIDSDASDARGPIERCDIATMYFDGLCGLVDGAATARAGLKVVFDPLYGATRGYMPSVLGSLGVDVVEIHGEPDDDTLDTHPEPAEPWVDACEQAVMEVGATIGLVADGDGVRLGAVDEHGVYVAPRIVTALVLEHLLKNRGETGRVVLGVSASAVVKRVAEAYGCRVTVRPVGFEYIYKEMRKGDVLLGADELGGIAVGGHLMERDALYPALLLCEYMAAEGKTLSGLVAELEARYGATSYAHRDLRVGPEVIDVFRTMLPGLNPRSVAGLEPVAVSHMDGLRLGFADGSWVLMRPSRTRPVVRVCAEAGGVRERDRLLEAACGVVRGGGPGAGA